MTSDHEHAFDSAEEPGSEDAPSLWWALHRPETYAITAFTLAVITLLGFGPAYEVVQAFLLGPQAGVEQRTLVAVPAAIRLSVTLVAALCAVLSIRHEDTGWSPPVARAALLVTLLSAALAVATLIGALTADLPPSPEFSF